jgi:flavin reductase (DIM6/NTAB) family NADH-FMN oxidoreductase RutF
MNRVAIAPTTVLQPHPVLLVGTFGADGKPNVMNAAWGGICCSDPPCVAVSLREATLTSRPPTMLALSLAATATSSAIPASRR